MRAIAWLLRVFCYLFHTMISVTLLALGVVGTASGGQHMKVQMLPWQGAELTHWLIGLGAAGLASVILAVTGKVRILLPLWSTYVLGMLIKGVFLTSTVSFDGRDDFHNWLLMICGAVLALIGSFTMLGRRRAA
ncbi:MAG TPA: hypothetical protein VNU44_05415 [Bryobacteraceae bacterium]|jgi:hypothetical protein|nr:hypothetical protein [Bryobacteraceae bacterium]